MSRILTLNLLRNIGSPLVSEKLSLCDTRFSEQLYSHAINNKIPLLYLDSLKQRGALDEPASEYEKQYAKYKSFTESVSRVSGILSSADIQHVIFKTIKPYLGMGGDIDILVLGDYKMYRHAVKELLKAKYVSAVLPDVANSASPVDDSGYDALVDILIKPTYGTKGHISPTGTDLIDTNSGFMIDLQNNMAMNYLIYFDKSQFVNHIMELDLTSGQKANVLIPELDLATMIAHSAMEHIYLLGEYYTFIFHLSHMDKQQIMNFINIVKVNKLKVATVVFTTISAELHKEAFGVVPDKLRVILDSLGFSTSEAKALRKDDFKMPHKYQVLTVARVLSEKLGDQIFRQSVPTQILRTCNPKLAKLVVHELINMRRRDTYLKGG